jgi:predicted ATPase
VSVVPKRVPVSVLDDVMSNWAAAAEEPERRRLLEVEAGYVRFRHELARHAIASSMTAAARRRVHAGILAALLEAGADPAEIVHHAEAAAEDDVVAEYATVAARRASALESHREAFSHYLRSADFADRLPPTKAAALLFEARVGGVRRLAPRRGIPAQGGDRDHRNLGGRRSVEEMP